MFHVDLSMAKAEDDGVEAVSAIISILRMQPCKVSRFLSFLFLSNECRSRIIDVLLNVGPQHSEQ